MSGNTITEKTLIPLSLVIVLIGGVSWLSTLYVQMKNLEEVQSDYIKTVNTIDHRLSRIEGKLGVGMGETSAR